MVGGEGWVVGEGVKRGGFEGGKRGWSGVGVILWRIR